MANELTEAQRERYLAIAEDATIRKIFDDENGPRMVRDIRAMVVEAVALAAREDLIAEMSTAAMVEAGGEIMDHGDTPEYRHLYRVSCWIRDYTPEPADPDTSDGKVVQK